jgi:hypothetical protein
MADALALRNLLLEKLKAAGFDTGHQNQDYWYAVAKALALMFSGGTLVHNDTTGRDASDCHPMSAITGLVNILNSKVNVNDIQSPHGFPLDDNNAQQTTISYNTTTRQLTITALSGSTFDIWVKGVKYTIASPHVSTAHTATEGKWYYSYDGTDFTWSQTAWDFIQVSPVASVYYSSLKGSGVAFDERHTSLRSTVWHRWAHDNLGTLLPSGGILSGYTLATDTDAAVTFGISETVIDDEDLRTTIAALADNGPYILWRRSGTSGYWTYDTAQSFPFYYGTYARYNYDAGGGTGWTLGDISGADDGTYVSYYMCGVPALDTGMRFLIIPGQINHVSQVDAENENWHLDVDKGSFPFLEIAPFAKVILKSSSAFGGTTKTEIVKIQYLYIDNIGGGAATVLDGKVAAANGDGRDYLAQKIGAFSGLYKQLDGAPPNQIVDIGIIPGEDTDVMTGAVTWKPSPTESLLGDFFFTSHSDTFLAKSLTLQDDWRSTPSTEDAEITNLSGWAPILNAEFLSLGLCMWPMGPWTLRLRLKKSEALADVTVRATVYRKTEASVTTQLFQTTFDVTDTDYDLYTYTLTQDYSVGGRTDGLYVLIEASTSYTDPVTVTMEFDDAELDSRLETPLGTVSADDIFDSTTPTNLFHCYALGVTKGGATNYSFYGPNGWEEIAGGNFIVDPDGRVIFKILATATVPTSVGWEVRLLIDGVQHENKIHVRNEGDDSTLMEIFGMWEVPYTDDDTHTYSIEMEGVGSSSVVMGTASNGATENFTLVREFYKIDVLSTLLADQSAGSAIPPYSDYTWDANTLVFLKFNELAETTSFKNEVTGSYDFSVSTGTVYPGGTGPQGLPAENGGLGGSIWIPGTTSDVRVQSAAGAFEPAGDKITVSAWVWMDDYTRGSGSTRIIHKPYRPSSWTAPYDVVTLCFNAFSGVYLAVYTSGASCVVSGGSAYICPRKEWMLLSGVYDGSYVRLYLNGRQIGNTNAQTGNIGWQTGGNAGPWVIGEPNGLTGEGVNLRQGPIWIEGIDRSAAYLQNLYRAGAKRY